MRNQPHGIPVAAHNWYSKIKQSNAFLPENKITLLSKKVLGDGFIVVRLDINGHIVVHTGKYNYLKNLLKTRYKIHI